MSAHTEVTRPRWYEEHLPSQGVLPARSWLRSDAPRLDLSGDWRFRWSPRADVEESFAAPDFDDSAWESIAVPGHWQLAPQNTDGRWGRPAYTNVQYPFPVDPPHVPDENPTGDHRLVVTVPDDLAAVVAAGGRAVLRFEGVDSAFRVWVDGVEVGRSVGSRLPSEFDVTDQLAAGGDDVVVAVRVHQWSSGTYLEDQDMWWLSGIFRDVALLGLPAGGVQDVHVHAGYDHTAGTGSLRVEVETDGGAAARVLVPELGLDLAAGEEAVVPVDAWSAEAPRLYDAEVATGSERVRLRIGFRTVAITPSSQGAWDVFTVNGARTLLRGVNRHEVSADRGRSVTPAEERADVLLMKQHGVNAVRTSHYPPHPRFLDLCDELGLHVVDECDLETHGFLFSGWRRNPSDDPAWEAAMVDRVVRTVHRDKNHASVVLWSLGNESGVGRNLSAMARAAREVGTGLPLHYEHDWGVPDVDVYSRMYASHEEVARIARGQEAALGSDEALAGGGLTAGPRDDDADARRRRMPFVQCEYVHAMGLGPGGVAEYQDLFESSDRCMGGFVWEWVDHGLRQVVRGRERWAYGGDFGEEVHDGNFVADGLLFPDRSPSPGLLDVAVAYAPVKVVAAAPGRGVPAVRVTNRYDVRRLDSRVALTWTCEDDGVEVAAGSLELPDLGPWESAELPLPEEALSPVASAGGAAERWVTVTAVTTVDEPWAAAGHVVGSGQVALGPVAGDAAPVPSSADGRGQGVVGPVRRGSAVVLGGATFDAATGALRRLGSLPVGGLHLDLWRAPTDNDEGENGHLADLWRAVGLHRLQHQVRGVELDGDALVVTTRVAPPVLDLGVLVTHRWSAVPAGGSAAALRLDVDVQSQGEWTVPWPRVGVRLLLPRALERATWFGRGPGEAYPDTGLATQVSLFTASVEGLQTPYVMPQENGHRADVRWLELTGAPGSTPGLRVEGLPTTGFTARRWTTEDLAAARHDAELVPGPDLVVTLDAALHGTGTGSCGPGVLPSYVLAAQPRSFSVVLRELPA